MKAQRYWASNTGRVSCEEHGGNYLKSAVSRMPKARRIVTPLDAWERLTAREIDEIREWNPQVCEGCRYHAQQSAS